MTGSTPATAAVQRETRTIPIVFVNVGDPVASGLVARLDRPSGNVTGFASLEGSLGGTWLELLSEIAPGLKRAAIMFNPDNPGAALFFMPSFETAARSLKVELIISPVHSDGEIETAIIALGREPVALSSIRMYSCSIITRRSYWRQRETTYQRSMDSLHLPETAVCSLTDLTR